LDVNGEINYVTSSTTRRVHNDTSNTIKTSGAIYFDAAWANVDTTYYKVDLPTAGTYLIYGTFRALHDGDVVCFAKVRLYNNTDAAVVTNSDRMLIEIRYGAGHGLVNMMCSSLWQIAVTAAKTIYLQGYATAANTAGIQCDSNGYDEFGYVRLF